MPHELHQEGRREDVDPGLRHGRVRPQGRANPDPYYVGALRRDDEVVGVFGIAVPLAQTASLERSPLDDLTPRQLEVLRLLAEGLETPQIASRLGVAEETARNHIRALLRATGAHSRLGRLEQSDLTAGEAGGGGLRTSAEIGTPVALSF